MNCLRSTRRAAATMLAVLALALSAVACTELDESAKTFISPDQFYRNDAQAAQAVNGVYAPLMGWNGWKAPAAYSLMCEDNELFCWDWMAGGYSGRQGGQWYMQDNSVYIGDYQIIERANQVIAYVPASGGISAEMKDLAVGQALFARGYAYFDLVRRFGGVPLRTSPYVPDASYGAKPRAPADSVWLQVASDLKRAAELLPEDYAQANGRGLPRRASALGLLAKAYLHMAGEEVEGTPLAGARTAYLDSAKMAALEVRDDPSVALEQQYADLFDVNKQNTSKEVLFAVQGAAVNNSGSQIGKYFGPRGDCTLTGGCGDGFLSLRQDFYQTFDPDDKRIEPNRMIAMSWEVTRSPYGRLRTIHNDSLNKLWAAGAVVRSKQFRWESWLGGCGAHGHWYDSLTTRDASGNVSTAITGIARPYYTLKYTDRQNLSTDQSNAQNILILRFADVLLVLAEAENELNGPTNLAYEAINAVRERAGIDPLSGLSQAQFRQAVWLERQHELYAEFQSRFDLIRQGRWLEVMNAPSPVNDFRAFGACKPREDWQKLQNIPARELAANPAMEQNPGW